jgi:hypothetical protein
MESLPSLALPAFGPRVYREFHPGEQRRSQASGPTAPCSRRGITRLFAAHREQYLDLGHDGLVEQLRLGSKDVSLSGQCCCKMACSDSELEVAACTNDVLQCSSDTRVDACFPMQNATRPPKGILASSHHFAFKVSPARDDPWSPAASESRTTSPYSSTASSTVEAAVLFWSGW